MPFNFFKKNLIGVHSFVLNLLMILLLLQESQFKNEKRAPVALWQRRAGKARRS